MNNWRNICKSCAKKLDVEEQWVASDIVSGDPDCLCEECWNSVSKVGYLSDVSEDVIAFISISKKSW